MMRRLYFLFHSTTEAQATVSTLKTANIPKRFMHALARGGLSLGDLPRASLNQQHDLRARLTRFFWNGDLLIFAIALVGLIIALFMAAWIWATVALALMIVTYSIGAFYAMNIPEHCLAEFRAELSHGEILLMVDVPKKRLHEIEALIHSKHSAADCEGSSWTLDVMGI